jgi:hypothetical protein
MAVIEIKKHKNRTVDKTLLNTYYRMSDDYAWILANMEKLRKSFPDEYIAVQSKTVRFANESIQGIIRNITDSGEQVENYAIEYIGKQRVNFLF